MHLSRRMLLYSTIAGFGRSSYLNAAKQTPWSSFEPPDHFPNQGVKKRIYQKQGTGKALPVLFLHELGGLSTPSFEFATRLQSDTGYSMYLPLLFGRPGQESSLRAFFRTPAGTRPSTALRGPISAPSSTGSRTIVFTSMRSTAGTALP
jgi:dienelactone hydrolase